MLSVQTGDDLTQAVERLVQAVHASPLSGVRRLSSPFQDVGRRRPIPHHGPPATSAGFVVFVLGVSVDIRIFRAGYLFGERRWVGEVRVRDSGKRFGIIVKL